MKLFFVILLCANVLFAQTPITTPTSTQAIPVLQEWWRADNMGYGINGMTWLDNFYNGKGALVISTPNGVQTWQLRYPWDTVNVFTWSGGDANIKTGDFNGDGVTDYLDDKGNIYIGKKQGTPPVLSNMKLSYNLRNEQLRISDLNNDGKSDVLVFADALYPNGLFAQVFLGNQIIDNIKPKNISRVGLIDTSSFSYCLYETEQHELRMITVYYQKGSFDGYKLYDVSLNNADTTIILKLLHEFMVSDEKRTCGGTNTLLIDNLKHTIHWVALEMINERRELTNVTVYDITNDTFNKLYSVRMDSVASFDVLTKSVNNDNVIDLSIRKMQNDGISEFNTYSGILQNMLMQLSSNLICQRTYLTSISDMNNNGVNEIAFSGNTGSCFGILLGQYDTTSSIQNNEFVISSLIKVLEYKHPSLTISISELTEFDGSAQLEIFNYVGRRLYSNDVMFSNTSISGSTILQLDNVGFTAGRYYVKITTDKVVKFGSFNLY